MVDRNVLAFSHDTARLPPSVEIALIDYTSIKLEKQKGDDTWIPTSGHSYPSLISLQSCITSCLPIRLLTAVVLWVLACTLGTPSEECSQIALPERAQRWSS